MKELVKDSDLLGLIENDRAYPAVIAAQINKAGSNLGSSSMTTMNPVQLLAANGSIMWWIIRIVYVISAWKQGKRCSWCLSLSLRYRTSLIPTSVVQKQRREKTG